MASPRLVYEIYIKATPERVWQGIVDPEFTKQYFHGTYWESTWEPGSPYRSLLADGNLACVGTIEECDPPRRLVMTWSFQYAPDLAAEPPSRVTWTLAPAGDGLTLLVVEHGDLFKSPVTASHVEHGWTWILDGLKTLVETGSPLPGVTNRVLAEPVADPEGEWHRTLGIAANNGTWEWLGKPADKRTAADEEAMTESAYAAAYHWARAARRTPANEARAQWLLSRVWVVRGNGELALRHADRSAAAVRDHGLVDFDLGYAHEARARALACLGRLDEARAELAAARAVPVADADDREIYEGDLDAGPWFALDA